MRRASVPLSLLLALGAATRARADVTTTPYPGVTHVRHQHGAERWHLVTIDLATPGVSMHVSAEANRGKRLSEIARAERAQLAINGAIFRKDHSTCGVALSRGAPWANVHDEGCGHAIGWSADLRTWALFTGKGLGKGPFPAGVSEALGGYPTLVRGGVPCDGARPEVCAIPPLAPADFKGPNPRTLLGVDQPRTKAFLVVVDGREIGAATGMTLIEAARFMAGTVHAWDAVNLDGGGSSELWIEGEGGVVNAPSDGAERVIADAIVVGVAGGATGEPDAVGGGGVDASAAGSGSAGGGGRKGWHSTCGCEVVGAAREEGAIGAWIAAGFVALGVDRRRARKKGLQPVGASR